MFDSLFSKGGLSLERLKVLIEVHDAGSIANATPGNPVRQSQYSRQLREVSEFFGCEVAERRGKLLKLTPEGVRLAGLARQFLRNLDDLRTEYRSERIVFNIGAGDSLIHWLVIPRLWRVLEKEPETRFGTLNRRTEELVQQVIDSRVDFGLVRKNAPITGLKSVSLGTLSYVAVVPTVLVTAKRPATFDRVFTDYPMAIQATEGEFTNRMRDIAAAAGSTLRPRLLCETFPQVFAAIKSERYSAILPEIAARELPAHSFRIIPATPLRQLQREIMLIWNPRVTQVRPRAVEVLALLQSLLRFS